MTLNKARQILQDNGIQWKSYFCLCRIEEARAGNWEGVEYIREAIEKMKTFIIRGTK